MCVFFVCVFAHLCLFLCTSCVAVRIARGIYARSAVISTHAVSSGEAAITRVVFARIFLRFLSVSQSVHTPPRVLSPLSSCVFAQPFVWSSRARSFVCTCCAFIIGSDPLPSPPSEAAVDNHARAALKHQYAKHHAGASHTFVELKGYIDAMVRDDARRAVVVSTPFKPTMAALPPVPELPVHDGFYCPAPDCGFATSSEDVAKKHEREHAGADGVKCRPCAVQFGYNRAVVRVSAANDIGVCALATAAPTRVVNDDDENENEAARGNAAVVAASQPPVTLGAMHTSLAAQSGFGLRSVAAVSVSSRVDDVELGLRYNVTPTLTAILPTLQRAIGHVRNADMHTTRARAQAVIQSTNVALDDAHNGAGALISRFLAHAYTYDETAALRGVHGKLVNDHASILASLLNFVDVVADTGELDAASLNAALGSGLVARARLARDNSNGDDARLLVELLRTKELLPEPIVVVFARAMATCVLSSGAQPSASTTHGWLVALLALGRSVTLASAMRAVASVPCLEWCVGRCCCCSHASIITGTSRRPRVHASRGIRWRQRKLDVIHTARFLRRSMQARGHQRRVCVAPVSRRQR